jgi:hypothetical protein
MRIPRFVKLELSEIILRGVGVALAAASFAFAFREASAPKDAPQIAGIEHLAIYAKLALRGSRAAIRAEKPGIDYTPIGAIPRGARGAMLGAYEIVDASAESALIRLPEGRVLRVAPGDRIAGLGEVRSIRLSAQKWIVQTEGGAIRQE